MNVVDSSGWIEYFEGGPGASFFSLAIEKTAELLVPAVVLYEVHKRLLQIAGESEAIHASALMSQGKIIEVDASLALESARFSFANRLAMADSLIYITARRHKALLWTQDEDLAGLPRVKYRAKRT